MMEFMTESKKTRSKFTVKGDKKRAFLTVSGEAATNAKVVKEIERVRTSGGSFDEVCWIARQLANTY